MEFTFTEEQERLRSEGLDLAGPVSGEPRAEVTEDVFRTLTGKGLAAVALPADAGGRALDVSQLSALWEGLGQGAGAALASALSTHAVLSAVALDKLGTDEQRRSLLPGIADGSLITALSSYELAGGAARANRALTATVRPDGGWLLEGTKTDVVNAPFAGLLLVTAATGPTAATAFAVPRDTPGLGVTDTGEGLGNVTFDGVEVPAGALLGTPDAAYRELLPLLLALDATITSATWIGVLRTLLDRALDAALNAEFLDRPVQRFQDLRFSLADSRSRIELATGLVYRAAWELDHQEQPGRQDTAVAKLFTVRGARATLTDVTRVLALADRWPDPAAEAADRALTRLEHAAHGTDLTRSAVAASVLGLG
ncbi:acyl-CoA dehydrogenase family protein [Actinacidiphila acididurans]|uniref:Acyl-CoA dehydrogenase family protein n=1 Tax=Actinacidiphila acididurans TaxID=2784346 RepID=A0ABS2TW55_9ACTN|nr:acyl-CoA dehydrogenase family protein [Actinacidiphila acididurans]MBM9507312.1 acyl-CoA dehydrogenase family protein [Actinacidiphila acididurans]